MATRIAELRGLPDEELIAQLEGNKEELFALRFQLATGQLDNPNRIKQVRHDIARILTILREHHREAELEEQLALADERALGELREAQASGDLTGVPLADAEKEALEEDEVESPADDEEEA